MVDERVREYDKMLARSCRDVEEELEMMSPKEILEKQEETILRFGGTIEVQKHKAMPTGRQAQSTKHK